MDFRGLVTYAVKSNPEEVVIENLSAAGIRGFDVASPVEMRLIRRLAPDAAMHYNNPVRARAEIAVAVELGVKSYSVDSDVGTGQADRTGSRQGYRDHRALQAAGGGCGL